MAALGDQWPWPRSRHAALVTALREAGAKAIALDIVFAEPSAPQDDLALKQVGGGRVRDAADRLAGRRQRDLDPAVPVRDHPAGRAAHQRRLALNPDHEPAAVVLRPHADVERTRKAEVVDPPKLEHDDAFAHRQLAGRPGYRYVKVDAAAYGPLREAAIREGLLR